MICYYEHIGNQYALMSHEKKLLNIFSTIGFMYSVSGDQTIIHLHGDGKRVRKAYNDLVFSMAQCGQYEQIKSLKFLCLEDISCHELNHCLESPSHIDTLQNIDEISGAQPSFDDDPSAMTLN